MNRKERRQAIHQKGVEKPKRSRMQRKSRKRRTGGVK